ncbi:MAG: SRPBCC domain-containing protein [Deltaproteobacteria bacterium]|nr:SRPBCC domain-containing protein [Deltaproteobacteria bacterium]
MNRLHFSIIIHSRKEKVWKAMLDPETFTLWTEAFAKGSYFEGSWNKGEKIRFLTPEGEGMSSIIAENKPFEFISIKHLGIIKDGVEDTQTPESKAWAPAFENYTFEERDGATELKVDVDAAPEFEEYMNRAWPKALARLKEICEGR